MRPVATLDVPDAPPSSTRRCPINTWAQIIQSYDTYKHVGYHDVGVPSSSVQGRFEMTRGMLVPRAEEDADDDGFTIFEGPGAVPLGALVWPLITVDETDATRSVVSGRQHARPRDGIQV
jgi:hypothetical protein